MSDLNDFPAAGQEEVGLDRRVYPESAIGRAVFKMYFIVLVFVHGGGGGGDGGSVEAPSPRLSSPVAMAR